MPADPQRRVDDCWDRMEDAGPADRVSASERAVAYPQSAGTPGGTAGRATRPAFRCGFVPPGERDGLTANAKRGECPAGKETPPATVGGAGGHRPPYEMRLTSCRPSGRHPG